tara:strand:- start:135 stop:671 length:537 start_codon:yes stop_codon:yes gene_type:complete
MSLFLFADDKKNYLDLNFLKKIYNEGSLKNSNVFGLLFNLETSDMNLTMRQEDGVFTIFKDLDINLYDWNILLSFLKYGTILDKEANLEKIIEVGNKLGGIESLDIYIGEYLEKLNKLEKEREEIDSKYNPMKPKEDYLLKYHWVVGSISSDFMKTHDVTINVENQGTYTFYYMRKLK